MALVLRPASGARIHPGRVELFDHFFVAHLVKPRKEIELDHRQRFQMQLRKLTFERREKIGVVLERKFRVQSADDVQFGRSFGDGGACDLDAFFDRMCICAFLTCTFIKPAKLAIRNADVRVVKMPVDVVIRRQAVLAAANCVGQLAESVQVARLVKRNAFVERQTLAILDLEGDLAKF